jgi:hypothetical protein
MSHSVVSRWFSTFAMSPPPAGVVSMNNQNKRRYRTREDKSAGGEDCDTAHYRVGVNDWWTASASELVSESQIPTTKSEQNIALG